MTEVVEAPGAESAQELKRITHWINGTSVAGEPGRSGPVYNPAAGIQTGEVDFASVEEVDAAVRAAREAFATWRAMSLSRRTEIFFRIRQLMHEHREDIAKLLTAEHGKVLSDALGEVARGLEVIEFCCGIPELLKGGFSEQASTGIDVYSIRQPLGVCAGITPFNFPAMVPMWMWAPALACGNTFVLKPSEKDPSASIYTAELLKEAGIPDGVFTVVHGDKVAGGGAIRAAGHARASRQGRLLHREGERRGGDDRHRRARVRAGWGRFLPRRHPARRRQARDGRLQGRDLRAGARRHPRFDLRRGPAARERKSVWERRRDLHARRRRRAAVPVRRQRRHGRDQRADPRPPCVLLVRRLEELPLRRPTRLRAGGNPVLHARQGRHLTLAGSGDVEGRPGLPADPVNGRDCPRRGLSLTPF